MLRKQILTTLRLTDRVIERLAAVYRKETRRSALPRRAAARCTSPAASRSCSRCVLRPTRDPTSPSAISSSVRLRMRVSPACSPLHGRFHADEPLLGGAEDDRIMAAPAMRIGVLHLFRMHEHAASLQQFDDRRVRIENALAFVLGQSVAQDSCFIDIAGGIDLVFLPVMKSSAP